MVENKSSDQTAFEIYRSTTVGTTLQETLDEMLEGGQITPSLRSKILEQFDKSAATVMEQQVLDEHKFKARKLASYRFSDDVWTLRFKDVNFQMQDKEVQADKVLVIACSDNQAKRSRSRRFSLQ
ncbi:transcription initiation factor IIA subunit 2-like [Teleopsis dalmanni]|uniref:transcription initiation factor IIA subunit 2-like n=1 Tax=Teleopsis dalmanni TaxID=139649 RepID=UPI0018CFCB0B|nr:transcription initiation factor IIA subunit 2-like [Teleopsis dalmanni]